MNVLFLNPPWVYRLPRVDRSSNLLGLLYLSSTAKRKGHKVKVLDALREGAGTVQGIRYRNTPLYLVGLSYDEIISRIPQDTDCVAISAPFTNLHFVVDELARRIRENRPDILLALGGGLPSAHPASRSYDSSFDVVVAGEGEIVFSGFLDHPRKKAGGEAPKYLKGIQVENLDALPIPDRNLIPSEYFQMSARKRSSLPTASLITSRGCPHRCHFCSIHSTMGKGWRGRSVESVMEEIRLLVRNHEVEILEFEDDNLAYDEERALRIFEAISRFRRDHFRLLSCSLPNGIRIDRLTDEMLALMKQSGVHKVVFSIEHGDLGMRRKMGKPLDDAEIYSAAIRTSSVGIAVEIFVMIGYPGETDRVFRSGLVLLKRLSSIPAVRIRYLFPQPYPGTQLREDCILDGHSIDSPDGIFFCGIGPVITTKEYDKEELERRRKEMDSIGMQSRLNNNEKEDKYRPGNFSNHCGHWRNDFTEGTRIVREGVHIGLTIGGRHNGSYFRGCKITGSSFRGAKMEYSEFLECDFSQADLTEFDASNSVFRECKFQGSRLERTRFSGCDLRGADFSGITLKGVDFTRAELYGACFTGASFHEVDLGEATAVGADFAGAIFHRSNLSGIALGHASMDGALLKETRVRDAYFESVSLRGITCRDVALHRSRFVTCDLTGSVISGHLLDADFDGSVLTETTIDEYAEDGTPLREVWDGTGRHLLRESRVIDRKV